jgi:hypothetical protein
MKIPYDEFVFYFSENFKHEGIKFGNLPIRFGKKDKSLFIFHIWHDDSLNESIKVYMKIFRNFQNKFEFPLNCLPISFLKKKFVKQVRKLFYDYIKFNVKS